MPCRNEGFHKPAPRVWAARSSRLEVWSSSPEPTIAGFAHFDARTGKELWVAHLEASGHATPITFLGQKTKRQFVAIAAGGGGYFSTTTADVLAAYALPEGQ